MIDASGFIHSLLDASGLSRSDAFDRFRRFALRRLVSGKIRHTLYSEIAALGDAETEPYDACQRLYRLESREGARPYRLPALLLKEWSSSLRLQQKSNGKGEVKLSDAIAEWAPLDEATLISAYEEAGRRNEGLRVAASLAQDIDKVVLGIVFKTSYPLGLLAAMVFIVRSFATDTLPQLLAMMPASILEGQAAGPIAKIRLISTFSLPFFIGLFLLLLLIFATLPYWRGRLRVFADNFPPWSFYKIITSARFLLTLGALLKAGQKNEKDILALLAERASPYLRQRIFSVQRRMSLGEKLGTAFYRCGYDFPDPFSQYRMQASADLPSFSKVIQELANGATERARQSGAGQAKILEIVIFIAFGAGVMSFFSAVMTILDAAANAGRF